MHAKNILHRDMKPENVLLTDDKEITIKLTDFGLACPFQDGKKLSEAQGSPLYSAPEIVTGQNYNEKVDIWGIGIIAHIVLCGSPPFNGSTNEEISLAIREETPQFNNIKKKLTYEAVNFTTKCLNKDPAQRPTAK